MPKKKQIQTAIFENQINIHSHSDKNEVKSLEKQQKVAKARPASAS